MAVRNEHLVVVMLERVPPGEEFEIWPMHITVVPWFPCEDARRLDETLTKVAIKHSPFEVKSGKIERWGKGKDKFDVRLIEGDHKLHSLHWDVLRSLEKNGFPIHQKDYLGEKYTPHITLRNSKADSGRFQQEEAIKISKFTLVRQVRLKGSGRMIKSLVKDYELE